MTRKEFCVTAASFAGFSLRGVPLPEDSRRLAWANLVHLGMNMWSDRELDKELSCQDVEWLAITNRMAEVGMNMIVIDLAEGLVYPSHPELAIPGSWSADKLSAELARLRRLGIEPIPKVNFSATHDAWMGDYARMVSTPRYYQVCADIIRDVSEIFGHPRLMHIGFDEEAAFCQKKNNHVVVRQGDLWWHDFLFIVKEVERRQMRPWMWSDYAWDAGAEYYAKCPKSVVQSNWYYSVSFDMEKLRQIKDEEIRSRKSVQMHEYDQVDCYLKLDKAGFDQIPCGGNWREDLNFSETVKFCRANLSKDRLLGFMMTSWRRTTKEFHEKNMKAVELVGAEIKKGA